jgi:hypothetical protein
MSGGRSREQRDQDDPPEQQLRHVWLIPDLPLPGERANRINDHEPWQ